MRSNHCHGQGLHGLHYLIMYFVTSTHSVAVNPKVASGSLARAIILAFYPDVEARIQAAHYPPGKGPENTLWHSFCPSEKTPSHPVVAVIREPVARFRSACGFLSLDAEEALTSLETGSLVTGPRGKQWQAAENVHFLPQARFDTPGATLFALEDIEAAARLLGLQRPLPVINEGGEPIVLTPEQRERVLAYYAADAALYGGL